LYIIFSSSTYAEDVKQGRFFEDQSDANDDFQIHFIYMLDSVGKDNEFGELEKIIHEMNDKMYKLTGNKQKYKFDYRKDGKLDISFVRLNRKGTKKGWNNQYPDYFIQKLGFNNPKKLYYSFVDSFNHRDSGQMGVQSGYTFMKRAGSRDEIITITLHELLHGQGFSWICTKGDSRGHVMGPSILSNENRMPNMLGNMIYNHKNKGCPDLKDSVYLTPTSEEPYDPLSMVCHLAERSGRSFGPSYGFKNQWPTKYNHKKFKIIKKGSYWCNYKMSEFARDDWFADWKK